MDRNKLTRDEKEQYDAARSLYKAVEDARKLRNFNSALSLSQKAAMMATLLVKSHSSSPTSL